ncbi:MAG TPA: preprotein translocase subunit SecY, partial [Dehalococcoidia bacterium]|nr:preprotein translocase subunit SecY [Dehalococcoidia bacterium]
MAVRTQQRRSVGGPRLLRACVQAFEVPEIRSKLFFTFALLAVFRLFATIPVPNVNTEALKYIFSSSSAAPVLGFLNVFSGGTLKQMSIAATGVYPYITSSIILQLLTPMIPQLKALSKEGEQGRNQIMLYTHYLTVPIALFQAYAQLQIIAKTGTPAGPAISNIGFTGSALLPTLAILASMLASTLFLVWLGELITDRGIGNGISLIITVGILGGLPSVLGQLGVVGVGFALTRAVPLVIMALVIIVAIVFFQEAERRI